MKLTKFQENMLGLINKGYGISANRRDFDHSREKREMEELVKAGLITTSKNHSGDNHGCYCKIIKTTSSDVKKKEGAPKPDEVQARMLEDIDMSLKE